MYKLILNQIIFLFYHLHPYKPYIKVNTTSIIVGTLPPPRFSTRQLNYNDVDFSYGSSSGLLWKVLDSIFDLKLDYKNTRLAVKQRKNFLDKNKIGICDIVYSAFREKIDASDLGMQNVKLRNILSILKSYLKINTLIFTGGNSTNGPEYFFRKLLKKEGIFFKQIEENSPRKHQFHYYGRTFFTYSLVAPSGAANRSIGSTNLYKNKKKLDPNYTTFDFRVEQYKEVFLPNR